MELTPRQTLLAATATALAVALVLAVLMPSWRWSILVVGAMVLFIEWVTVLGFRREERLRTTALARIERKVDNLALRVVTESEAMHRELAGLIEELGSAMRDNRARER